jgi:hypothetical protein
LDAEGIQHVADAGADDPVLGTGLPIILDMLGADGGEHR